MAKGPKICVFWKVLFGTVTCLSFALPVLSDRSKMAKTTCPDWYGLNYTLPMFKKCELKRLQDGSMVQSIPKLIPFPSVIGGCHQRKSKEGIPGGQRICRFPYCVKDLCKNGWCEETMVGYDCHCSSGFQGRHCDEQVTVSTEEASTKPTTSHSTIMSDATTTQNTTTSKSTESSTTDATTKPTTNPTTMMSDTTPSQETPTTKSSESSTTDAKTKSITSPTTTMSDTTASQETTTSKSTESSTTESTTKPGMGPTTTMSDPTSSQETSTTKSSESLTTDTTTKPMTSPTTTMSDTTASQETTTSTTPACLADPTGVNYRGNLSQTINGQKCKVWTSQHDWYPASYPNAGLDENYCRNPNGFVTAWCYTTNPGRRWEYCAVGSLDPICQE